MKLVIAVTAAFLATGALAATTHSQQPSVPSYPNFGASTESSTVAPPGVVTVHRYSFTIAANADSPLVDIPKNTPSLLMGTGDVSGERGVGHVTIWSVHGSFLQWSGQDFEDEENNYSSVTSHILWLDFNNRLLEVQAVNGTQIKVHNARDRTVKVELTLMY